MKKIIQYFKEFAIIKINHVCYPGGRGIDYLDIYILGLRILRMRRVT